VVLFPLSVRCAARWIALLLWIGCSGAYVANVGAAATVAAASGELKAVVINHFKYQPERLTIHEGDTVEWTNLDIVPHTATAVNRKPFDSGRIAKGASWRFTFTRKGTYEYLCTLHPNMKGKLVVE
jgi:plastocyanin